MKKTLLILALALPLAACGAAGTATEVRVQTQFVPVQAQCPDDKTYDALAAGRPVPLRSTPMPATAQERSDKTTAQLGRFEAPGGWADKAQAALKRCHDAPPLPATTGVASPP